MDSWLGLSSSLPPPQSTQPMLPSAGGNLHMLSADAGRFYGQYRSNRNLLNCYALATTVSGHKSD